MANETTPDLVEWLEEVLIDSLGSAALLESPTGDSALPMAEEFARYIVKQLAERVREELQANPLVTVNHRIDGLVGIFQNNSEVLLSATSSEPPEDNVTVPVVAPPSGLPKDRDKGATLPTFSQEITKPKDS